MRQPLFERFARYNRWANLRLYAACAGLADDEYRAARPAFFGSIHHTLNHILVADQIWLERIHGQPPSGLALDAEVHARRDDLAAARVVLDERIVATVEALPEAGLDRRVCYRNSTGTVYDDDLAVILQHFFNHQTHHRGQVHDMLMATPVRPPSLDLIAFTRELSQG